MFHFGRPLASSSFSCFSFASFAFFSAAIFDLRDVGGGGGLGVGSGDVGVGVGSGWARGGVGGWVLVEDRGAEPRASGR